MPSPASPSTRPMPWTMASSAREAVIRGSFCRSDPAAELRGLANAGLARVEQRLVQLLERRRPAGTPRPAPRAWPDSPEPVQPRRDRGDRPDVRRDVLAGAAVAPGGRPDQRAVPVDQVDRQPVDLQLAQVRARRRRARAARSAQPPRSSSVNTLSRLSSRSRCSTGVNSVEIGAVHGLGRRVGRAQLRVLLLERAQLAHLGVVVDVGDGRRVEHVVPVIGLGDLQAQVGVPLPRVGGRLRACRAACPRSPRSRSSGLSPVSSISSGTMPGRLPAPGQRGAGLAGDAPASPQAGVITACSAHVPSGSPSRCHSRIIRSASRSPAGLAGSSALDWRFGRPRSRSRPLLGRVPASRRAQPRPRRSAAPSRLRRLGYVVLFPPP